MAGVNSFFNGFFNRDQDETLAILLLFVLIIIIFPIFFRVD